MRIKSLIEQEWSILGDPWGSQSGREKGRDVLENFCPIFSPDPTDCPWVSEDGSGEKFSITFAPSLSL